MAWAPSSVLKFILKVDEEHGRRNQFVLMAPTTFGRTRLLAMGFAVCLVATCLIPMAKADEFPTGITKTPCAYLNTQPGLSLPQIRVLDFGQLCFYEKANLGLRGQKIKVVFFGDSITEWWGSDKDLFSKERGYYCRGIGGQTTSQMLVRFKADVLDLKPQVVHILAGTNDIAGNTGPTSAERIKNNIRSMVEQAQANGIKVIIGSVLPASRYNWNPDIRPAGQILDLNRWLKAYAASVGARFVDYYSSMLDPESGGLMRAYTDDGVHPNPHGYQVMKPIVLEALRD